VERKERKKERKKEKKRERKEKKNSPQNLINCTGGGAPWEKNINGFQRVI
jgi:hypothetical protein